MTNDEKIRKLAIIDTLNTDEKNKNKKEKNTHYVYALCEKTEAGELIPFYIGEGANKRLWDHEDGEEKEIKRIKDTFPEEEWDREISELSAKYQKIDKLGKDRIEKVIIKWGMTQQEAFMAESALINLLKLDGFTFSSKNNGLTNIQNGHASVMEKEMTGITKAMTVDQFFEECAQEPLDFKKDVCPKIDAILICINKIYRECVKLKKEELKDAVREAVRGFWRVRDNAPKYLIAMYQQKVVGVFRIKQTYIDQTNKSKTKTVEHLYTILDVWREDYPKHEKLPTRVKDFKLASEIYKVCEKDSEGKIVKTVSYSDLDDSLKELVRKNFDSIKKGKTYEGEFENWKQRKYFVLEDIADTDDDAEYNELVGRRIAENIDGKMESPIRQRSEKRYTRET